MLEPKGSLNETGLQTKKKQMLEKPLSQRTKRPITPIVNSGGKDTHDYTPYSITQ